MNSHELAKQLLGMPDVPVYNKFTGKNVEQPVLNEDEDGEYIILE